MKMSEAQLRAVVRKELQEAGDSWLTRGHPSDPSAGHLDVSRQGLSNQADSLGEALDALGYRDLAEMAWDIREALDA